MRRKALVLIVCSILATGLLVSGSAFAQDPVTDVSPLHDFDTDDPPRHGWSTLVRSEGGIAVTVDTKHLPATTPVTFWIVIFNNPGECTGPCGGDDLSDGDVGAAVVFGGAVVTTPNGKMRVSSGLGVDVPVGTERCCFGELTDPFGAEIHIIVRKHPAATDEDLWLHLQAPGPGAAGPPLDFQSAVHK